jgi:hypothetical protein
MPKYIFKVMKLKQNLMLVSRKIITLKRPKTEGESRVVVLEILTTH